MAARGAGPVPHIKAVKPAGSIQLLGGFRSLNLKVVQQFDTRYRPIVLYTTCTVTKARLSHHVLSRLLIVTIKTLGLGGNVGVFPQS